MSEERLPRLGCAGLIMSKDGKDLLMGVRDKDPGRGELVLPGGRIEFGESFVQTIQREILEEAGIEIHVMGQFRAYELIEPPDQHRVIIYMLGFHTGGELKASSDLSEVKFFTMIELANLYANNKLSPFITQIISDFGRARPMLIKDLENLNASKIQTNPPQHDPSSSLGR